jgi:hypothetical protein
MSNAHHHKTNRKKLALEIQRGLGLGLYIELRRIQSLILLLINILSEIESTYTWRTNSLLQRFLLEGRQPRLQGQEQNINMT